MNACLSESERGNNFLPLAFASFPGLVAASAAQFFKLQVLSLTGRWRQHRAGSVGSRVGHRVVVAVVVVVVVDVIVVVGCRLLRLRNSSKNYKKSRHCK